MKQYIAIDRKSFYASVEARERGLDPLTVNLVVADVSRTEKTICLAVSPSLKSYGIPGRARLFEVVQRVEDVNRARLSRAGAFSGESNNITELNADPSLKVTYIAATPRMSLYIEYSTRIYQIYLRYIAPEDIHVYSIDEVLIDATDYLNTYRLTAYELDKLKFAEEGGPMEKYVAWLGLLQEEELINSNVLTATYDDAMNAIATGETAIIFQGMFTLGTILSINLDVENELRVCAFPAVEDDVREAINQTTDSTYYITSDSQNQEAAKVFLDWLFSVEPSATAKGRPEQTFLSSRPEMRDASSCMRKVFPA